MEMPIRASADLIYPLNQVKWFVENQRENKADSFLHNTSNSVDLL